MFCLIRVMFWPLSFGLYFKFIWIITDSFLYSKLWPSLFLDSFIFLWHFFVRCFTSIFGNLYCFHPFIPTTVGRVIWKKVCAVCVCLALCQGKKNMSSKILQNLDFHIERRSDDGRPWPSEIKATTDWSFSNGNWRVIFHSEYHFPVNIWFITANVRFFWNLCVDPAFFNGKLYLQYILDMGVSIQEWRSALDTRFQNISTKYAKTKIPN